MNDSIYVREDIYEELIDSDRLLRALQFSGVDNWDGYDYAQEIYKELVQEEGDSNPE